ncbi:MAG: DUF934 domain-containing protein [Rhodoblastus sp.]|nr:DUF934 domain-containing protein [Rhodoblastus sp.]
MKLLDRDGIRIDEFFRATAEDRVSHDRLIVPPDALEAQLSSREMRQVGVEVSNVASVEELARYFDDLALIAIVFPAYSDGRGFTLARRLRNAGFRGVLRAVGPLIADQFAHALACGFDEIEAPESIVDRQPFEQWRRAGASISLPYQQGYSRATSIFEQRRRGRQGECNA